MIAIIGGSGLTRLPEMNITHRRIVRTPYGLPSSPLMMGKLGSHEIMFIARHGLNHTLSPHEINYRANIWALHSEGVKCILAVATVGSIDPELNPGDIALPEQLIDFTHSRKQTYFDGLDMPVRHIDFTEPYSKKMRSVIIKAANQANEPLKVGGVYAAVQGPRLETAAEVNRLERDGATMIGMTGMPEAALARELEIEYAAICPVANHAAGRGESKHGINYDEIGVTLTGTMLRIRHLLEKAVMLHDS